MRNRRSLLAPRRVLLSPLVVVASMAAPVSAAPGGEGKLAVTQPVAVNDRDEVAGNFYDGKGRMHGFLLRGGSYATLDVPWTASGTSVECVNDRGEIVGNYRDDKFQEHGFLFRHGAYTKIAYPRATGISQAAWINGRGEVVGTYYDRWGSHGFRFSKGRYTLIDPPAAKHFASAYRINDRSDVIGSYYDRHGRDRSFLLRGGVYTGVDLSGLKGYTYVCGIDDRGGMAGIYLRNLLCAFLLRHGAYSTLVRPAAGWTILGVGMSGRGEVFGNLANPRLKQSYGFVWNHGAYTRLGYPGATSGTTVFGINNRGDVVGSYDDRQGHTHGYLYRHGVYTPVDVPMNKRDKVGIP